MAGKIGALVEKAIVTFPNKVSKNVRELDVCSRPAYENEKLRVKILQNLKACPLVNPFTVPILDEEKKLTYIFIFTCFWCLKRFYAVLLMHHKKV